MLNLKIQLQNYSVIKINFKSIMRFPYYNEKRKESIASLEFFFFLNDFYSHLFEKKEKMKYKNSELNQFVDVIDSLCRWQYHKSKDYLNSLKDYVFWQYREFYLEEMQKFVSHESTGREFVDHFYFKLLNDIDEEPEPDDSNFLSENELRQIVKDVLPRVKKYFLEE